jgi:hypothetical protein
MDLRHNAFDIRAVERHCAALRRTTPSLRCERAAPLRRKMSRSVANALPQSERAGAQRRAPRRGTCWPMARLPSSARPRLVVAKAHGGDRGRRITGADRQRRRRSAQASAAPTAARPVQFTGRVRGSTCQATCNRTARGMQRPHGTWRIMRSESVPGRAGLLSLSGNPLAQLHQVGNSRLQTADRRAKHGGAPPSAAMSCCASASQFRAPFGMMSHAPFGGIGWCS